MVKALHVAEKPSVAKEIARILSGGQYRTENTGSKYNKVYHQFQYTISGQSYDMAVTSVNGHLMELIAPEEYRSWRGSDPFGLFDAPLRKVVSESSRPLQSTLEKEARGAQLLVLWLDCDREGENIAFEVLDVCRRANPRLPVKRAHFSALTAPEIRRAVATLGEPDRRLSEACDARQELDLRIGYAFTRLQTNRLADTYPPPQSCYSFGPCQFPTLGFIVDRYWAIERFVSEPFWSLSLDIPKDASSRSAVPFTWERVRLFEKRAVEILHRMCLEETEVVIRSVERRETRKYRPVPLNTVALQKLAARRLRLASSKTMELAEQLYREGLISYPRTETEVFSESHDHRSHLQQFSGPQSDHGAYVTALLEQGRFRPPRRGRGDDQSHPPIHPTKAVAMASLQPRAKAQLYDMVLRSYLACCSDDAIGDETKVAVQLGQEWFHARGLVVRARNFLDIYPYESWGGAELPSFHVGERLRRYALRMTESATAPPELLTEPELIRLMDQHGIGTDATIAQHIQTVQDRGYAVLVQHRFRPTPTGVALTTGYDRMGFEFSKPSLRAATEADLRSICDGSKNKASVLSDALRAYKDYYTRSLTHFAHLDQAFREFVLNPPPQLTSAAPPPPPPSSSPSTAPSNVRTTGRRTNSTRSSNASNPPPPARSSGTRSSSRNQPDSASSGPSNSRPPPEQSMQDRPSSSHPTRKRLRIEWSESGDPNAALSSNTASSSAAGLQIGMELGKCGKCGSVRTLGEMVGRPGLMEAVCATCGERWRLPRADGYSPASRGPCAMCKGDVLAVQKAGGGATYFACPVCFSGAAAGPCGVCPRRDCAYANARSAASAAHKLAPCPGCREGELCLRSREGASFYVGCTRYPACRHSLWLHPAVCSAEPASPCPRCRNSTCIRCTLSNGISESFCVLACRPLDTRFVEPSRLK